MHEKDVAYYRKWAQDKSVDELQSEIDRIQREISKIEGRWYIKKPFDDSDLNLNRIILDVLQAEMAKRLDEEQSE